MAVLRVMSVLSVSDLDSAVDTYVKVTGMQVVMHHGWIAILASPDDPSVQLGLITEDRTGPVNMDASVEVDDADAAHAAARDAGLEIIHELRDEEWGVRRFFFRDRDGNVINMLCHR
ncbi:VOC family protein [Streptomyces sp. YIM 98790]|uniref:VOC family protein n=1 Tax=Streptomyces sp. YIM 98790 TaxID=2689077 RepID=UPI001A9EA082|nr:VOC family protein [Streptomyces sp. YIM 98790]